jgi:YfiH family protein
MTDLASFDFIKPDWPAPANVRAFSTKRNAGFRKAPWNSLNLGENCGDDKQDVMINRQLLEALLPSKPKWLNQVHGIQVVNLDNSEVVNEADASVTATAGQVCAILTADCLPVLFCNRAGTKVAAAHAGWRGLANGVLEATVAAMDCQAHDLLAWLGPAIGPKAFEVGQDVFDAFTRAHNENTNAFEPYHDRWLADLYALARLTLARLGVKNVSGGQYCTYTQQDQFFSYRRDGETGRMASVIWFSD